MTLDHDQVGWLVGWINVPLELTVGYWRRFGIHRIGQTREHHSYRRLVFWNRGQMTRSAPEPAPPEVSFEHGGLWTTIRFSVHQSLIHGGYFCGGRDDINWRRWNFPSPKSPSCLFNGNVETQFPQTRIELTQPSVLESPSLSRRHRGGLLQLKKESFSKTTLSEKHVFIHEIIPHFSTDNFCSCCFFVGHAV